VTCEKRRGPKSWEARVRCLSLVVPMALRQALYVAGFDIDADAHEQVVVIVVVTRRK